MLGKLMRLGCVMMFTFAAAVYGQQNHRLIYDQLLRPVDAEFYHVAIGLCEDYPEETTTLEIIRNDMELLKRGGINLLRISFGWDGIETAKNEYDWLFWDDYVRMAVDEYHITLIPYICYTPQWNSTGDSTNFWDHTPIDYGEFGQFVEDIVNRYKDRIKSWELWNEPDITAYWSGTVAEYAKLFKIGAAAVRKADPEATIVLGGLAHKPEFTLALFRDLGVSEFVDVVNIHNYNETWGGNPQEMIVPYVNTIYDIIKNHGDNQSLWMAEVGYSTFRKDAHVSDHYQAYYDYEHTPKYQAVALIRTLTLLLSTNKLAAIAWYEIKDLPPMEKVIGDVNNRNLGVAFVDYKPKPAEHALSFFNKLFSEKNRGIDDKVVIKRNKQSDSEVHVFEFENGDAIVIGWLKTHQPEKRGPDKSGNAKDARKETVSVELPMKLTKATLYDELGSASDFKSVKVKNDKTIVENMRLVGGEIAIIKVSK